MSAADVSRTPENVKVPMQLSAPEGKQQLQSFLGVV